MLVSRASSFRSQAVCTRLTYAFLYSSGLVYTLDLGH